MPARRYRPGVRDGFESTTAAANEDVLRVRLIKKALRDHESSLDSKDANKLAKRLGRSRVPRTMASSRRMRRYRICLTGALWRLIDKVKSKRVSTVTLVPTDAWYTAEQLAEVNPRKLMEKLRADLNRYGATKADGWAVLVLHGEHEPESGLFQLHFHGVVADGMVDVADKLRKARKYKPSKAKDSGSKSVSKPVVISRKVLFNMPEPLTYVLKAYWPAKRKGEVASGNVKRNRTVSRIAEPFHSQVLLWLDRWRLSDITLMMKLSATRSGFKVSKSKKGKKGE